MTQEDKELLLKDLSARLPYGVKVYVGEDLAMTLKQIDYKCFCESWENEDFKSHSRWMLPYLRPISSMTEEEAKELYTLLFKVERLGIPDLYKEHNAVSSLYDWLNAHHFDYRDLIEKNLVLDCTGLHIYD